ncbi:thioredoxin family protein [Pseudoxanthomonas sp.]|uniref:thioredoxin family protein n=1 Tax=Pseudoxanthomonas sp. TaxID=1871049 RepID=UPI0026058A80|nr:thioredoxin family protein [Pseudoxanthomonas sp.]WDS34931.1 MAG: thioredoxin family protein [Pseudoxanthomonas sp.]
MAYTGRFATPEPAREQIDAMSGITAVEFGTAWCPHCISAQSPLQQAFDARPDITHVKVEDGRGRPLGRTFRVKLWPTIVLMRDGVEVARMIRPRSADDIQRALALLPEP